MVSALAGGGVEEEHFCAAHSAEALGAIARELNDNERGAVHSTDRCSVYVERVVCDGRDGFECYVHLRETGGPRRMAFPTGRFEAWALAWELRHEKRSPLGTHRAMADMLRALGGDLRSVAIDGVSDGRTFTACAQISHRGSSVVVRMRPSDAVILAVVCDIPIFVDRPVWQRWLSEN
jgi:bifunctional DNase/RNase